MCSAHSKAALQKNKKQVVKAGAILGTKRYDPARFLLRGWQRTICGVSDAHAQIKPTVCFPPNLLGLDRELFDSQSGIATGASDDGASDDGASNDGASNDGASNDGASNDGPSDG